MLSKLVWNATFHKLGAKNLWKEWDLFVNSSPEQQRKEISARMFSTIRYFGNREDALPEWKELAKASDPRDVWQYWSSLPILTKDTIRSRFDPDEIIRRFKIEGAVNTSGGSTGEPTRFVWDANAQRQKTSMQYYCWQRMGWSPDVPVICLWGSPKDIGQSESLRKRLTQRLRNITIIDGFEFSDQSIEETKKAIERSRKVAIYGYTSLLDAFARYADEQIYTIPQGKIVAAWNGAEPLHANQSALFHKALGHPIHNQYGGREFGAIANRLAFESSFHITRPLLFLEIINEQDNPCEPGEYGRVVLSTLIGRGTPFIRYDVGDLAVYSENDLTEAGLVGIRDVLGRVSSLIRLRDGRTFHSAFWHHMFKDYPEIRGFHVHQNRTGDIKISYIGAPLAESSGEKLNYVIRNMLGSTSHSLTRVDTLPKTSQGKQVQISSDFTY